MTSQQCFNQNKPKTLKKPQIVLNREKEKARFYRLVASRPEACTFSSHRCFRSIKQPQCFTMLFRLKREATIFHDTATIAATSPPSLLTITTTTVNSYYQLILPSQLALPSITTNTLLTTTRSLATTIIAWSPPPLPPLWLILNANHLYYNGHHPHCQPPHILQPPPLTQLTTNINQLHYHNNHQHYQLPPS